MGRVGQTHILRPAVLDETVREGGLVPILAAAVFVGETPVLGVVVRHLLEIDLGVVGVAVEGKELLVHLVVSAAGLGYAGVEIADEFVPGGVAARERERDDDDKYRRKKHFFHHSSPPSSYSPSASFTATSVFCSSVSGSPSSAARSAATKPLSFSSLSFSAAADAG